MQTITRILFFAGWLAWALVAPLYMVADHFGLWRSAAVLSGAALLALAAYVTWGTAV